MLYSNFYYKLKIPLISRITSSCTGEYTLQTTPTRIHRTTPAPLNCCAIVQVKVRLPHTLRLLISQPQKCNTRFSRWPCYREFVVLERDVGLAGEEEVPIRTYASYKVLGAYGKSYILYPRYFRLKCRYNYDKCRYNYDKCNIAGR